MENQQKVRLRPRISAAKLGDYIEARSAAARERILRDQKFPPNFITTRYRDAEHAMRSAVLSADDTSAQLSKAAERIARAPNKSKWQTEARQLCVRAVQQFAKIIASVEGPAISFGPPPADGYKLTVEGVAISVMPLVRVVRRQGSEVVGHGLMLCVIRKNDAVTERAAEAIAEVLRMAVEATGDEPVDPKLCMVVDVFAGKTYRAATRGKRMQLDLLSACREIVVRWDSLKRRGAA